MWEGWKSFRGEKGGANEEAGEGEEEKHALREETRMAA
jgi:hypothetical protein